MINSQKTLVAYLDIMGYREIINNYSPSEFYNTLVTVFKNVKLFVDAVQPKNIDSTDDVERQYAADLMKTVKFKMLSDAIIIYCDLREGDDINEKYYGKADDGYSSAYMFLQMISGFVVLFISDTGYLLRGGVCLGKFYTNTFDSFIDSELIFSEALVRGYELEQLANHPRILVDETLYNKWSSSVERSAKRDRDGEFIWISMNLCVSIQ
jgi:hypothetical protein